MANGIGGYAMGPRAGGEPTRGYHGWLVAATQPPDGRVLLVSSIETVLEAPGEPGRRLAGIELAAGSEAGIELSAGMVQGANATALTWRLAAIELPPGRDVGAEHGITLRLAPRLAGRDHHPGWSAPSPPVEVGLDEDGLGGTVRWAAPLPALHLRASRGLVERVDRTAAITYPEEIARGTAEGEILRVPLELVVTLDSTSPSVTLVLGTGTGSRAPLPDPAAAPVPAPATHATHLDALRAAAGRFVVHRPDPRADRPDEGVTVIAGYPWFGDWGRDTFIALPGLALATGRYDDAARILRTWGGLVRDGLLPNHFPESGRPAYHAIDAPLWFIHALGAYEDATRDGRLALDLLPAWKEILAAYADGTRFGIAMDTDGLVRGGDPGLQLTWMDAKVDGTVITPRHGKPVEIQALWIGANRRAAAWLERSGDSGGSARATGRAVRAREAFGARYRDGRLGWLRDVVDGPGGDDATLRPNQLLALAVAPDLVTDEQARVILDACERHLVVPGGVRTLAPFEPGYRPRFQGPPAFRDSAYHQGPAWTWLLGAWLDAVGRWRGEDAARTELRRHLEALDPDRTGAIPELLEPELPHAGRGCPFQAWGTAELLRVATRLLAEPA
ncbi:MAG TPA: amylo-alpha-1,6-glucosidase [Candidatus Limnocylindrales bacterium]|nr:amylo-alpha-1,6-glucosidase [Candidatus Limnocylindrales bacterium]